ncbi:MAG: protein phosphatase 2C domain-containing protein [Gemmataceae bacterium]|nr:protein phosphatase 2C domain-containing protein [Gemmata sp.]MDW8197405.1 protein phosphatase 2C domain-containing protein [Gemmataceae bacterium]
MAVVWEFAGATDVGRVRKNNEDHFLIADLCKQLRITHTSLSGGHLRGLSSTLLGHVLVVADGMGGTAGGELASGMVVETISWYIARTMPWFFRYQDGREEELENELRNAVATCQATITTAANQSHFRCMGTTLTLAYILWPRLYVVHAGDSRCYLHRGSRLARMTTDHTVAQKAIDEGLLTPEQAEGSVLAHTLWNYIGGGGDGVTPDIYHTTLIPGDELLLCTDGLTRHIPDAAIATVLRQSPTVQQAVDTLLAAANAAGGEDNITIVAARVRTLSSSDPTPPTGLAPVQRS